MFILLALVLGLMLGSFYNVVIIRVPRGESIVHHPSRCPGCQTRLTIPDLFPVLSYLLLRGRCRHCGQHIPVRYPLVELGGGFIAVVSYLFFGVGPEGLLALVFLSLLLILSAIDLEHFLLPDSIVGFGVAVGLPLAMVVWWPQWFDPLGGFLVGGGLFLLIAVVSRGGMGGGDIKMAAMIGLYLGWKMALLSFLAAFIVGGALGSIFLLLGIKGRKDHLPFGPMLAVGAALALFWGPTILEWYLGLI